MAPAAPVVPIARHPVHTVYGGAHLFRSDSAQKLGAIALRTFDEYAPDAATLAAVLGIAAPLAATVRPRIAEKLRREPVEDYRIDFEDGYGDRTDDEEDADARSAAEELAKGFLAAAPPPFIGIRVKPMSVGLNCGALTPDELREAGLTLTERLF